MQLKLYKSLDEKNRIRKTLTDELELNGALRDASSVMSPAILIQTEPLQYNYAYIPEFSRYYFINNITAMRNKAFLIELKCDVLMSYADEIYNLQALIDRTEEEQENYVNGDFVVDVRQDDEIVPFPNGFTTEEYVLLTMKGGELDGVLHQ